MLLINHLVINFNIEILLNNHTFFKQKQTFAEINKNIFMEHPRITNSNSMLAND